MSGETNSGNAPAVSIIIPHYNQIDALHRCLVSLAAQSYPAENVEFIVVDNDSTEPELVELALSALPAARLLTEQKKGAAHARNAGLAVARGRAIGFIDADCIAHPDWIANGVAALATTDLSGGEVIVTTARMKAPTAVEAFECVFAFHQRSYIKRKHFSVTANLFATRAAAEAIGPFKHGVSEDYDWCLRARALGFRLAFNDTSIISHPARRDWNELTSKWGRLILERWNGFGGRGPIRQIRWAGLAAATALSAAPHLAAVMFSTRIKGVRNKIMAAGILARIRFWRARKMLSLLQPDQAFSDR